MGDARDRAASIVHLNFSVPASAAAANPSSWCNPTQPTGCRNTGFISTVWLAKSRKQKGLLDARR